MKDYVLKIKKNETFAINIKDAKTIYNFSGVSKQIIDNIDKSEKEILKMLIDKYYTTPIEKIKSDYYDFIKCLNSLNINSSNFENIILIKDEYSLKNVSIEILNSCSFNCDHCYISDKNNYMNLEIYKKIINELVELGCDELLITGGEPMLHNNFIDMYLYAKKMGLIVTINSNISLLNENILKVLCDYKPNVIEISLYGFDNNSYFEFTHFSNGYTVVDNNIKKLIKNNININFKTVLTKKSKDYIFKIKEYAKKLKVPFRYYYVIFPTLDNISVNLQRCEPDEIIKILKEDKDATILYKHKIENINKKNNYGNHIFQCEIGINRMFISSNLDLRPCLVVPFKCNYKTYSIKDAYFKFEKIVRNCKFKSDTQCKKCYEKTICRYCPGRFYMENGSFENPPKFYCDLADKIIKEFS